MVRRSERLCPDAAAQLAARTTLLYRRAMRARAAPTAAERRFWAAVVQAGLTAQFVRQRVFRDYYVDICIPKQAVIEIDGEIHARQRAYDAKRDAYFARLGYRVRRLTNADVWRDADGLVAALAAEFRLYARPHAKPGRKVTDLLGRSIATAWLD